MAKTIIKPVIYGKWGNCLEISNNLVKLIATLDFGPRIIRFSSINGKNVFLEDVEGNINQSGEPFNKFGGGKWNIYGGHRLWHSPESLPRSYYPDNMQVEWTEVENGVKLRPQEEKWVQMQKEIEIILNPDSNNVKIIHSIINTGAWPVEFAPWSLSVMTPGGKEVVPQPRTDTGLLGNRVLALWPYTKMNDDRVYWGDKYITLRQDINAKSAFKFGINNEAGWAAYFINNDLFIKHYNHKKDGVYPDFGVSFETYTNEIMCEIETLGELKKTAPGETAQHIEEWKLFSNVPVPSNDEKEIENIINKYVK